MNSYVVKVLAVYVLFYLSDKYRRLVCVVFVVVLFMSCTSVLFANRHICN